MSCNPSKSPPCRPQKREALSNQVFCLDRVVSIARIASSQARRMKSSSLPKQISKSRLLPSDLDGEADCQAQLINKITRLPVQDASNTAKRHQAHEQTQRRRRNSLDSGGISSQVQPPPVSRRQRRYSLPPIRDEKQSNNMLGCSSQARLKYRPPSCHPRLASRLRMPLLTIDELCEYEQLLQSAGFCDEELSSDSGESASESDASLGCAALHEDGIFDVCFEYSPMSPPMPLKQVLDLALNAEAQTMSLLNSPSRPVRRLSNELTPVLCDDQSA
jgi:hypothetical protein